jgi:hypothetical protein
MPDAINRRCPRCGRKAHDRLLVQCPDCRVPFVFDDQSSTVLTPEQLRLVAQQIFGSWKFWAFLVTIIGVAAWGVVVVADRVIDYRAKEYISLLDQKTTNHIGVVFGQISNQIALEFRQPKIKATIEQVARERANDLFTNGVRPSLEAFQDAMDLANGQLIKSSNALAELEAETLAAERRIPTSAPAPVAIVQTPAPKPAVKPAPAPTTDAAVKMALVNRTLTPAGTGYLLTLFFRVTNGTTSGTVDIVAGTYNQTAKILNFAAMSAIPSAPPVLSDTADAARLRFNVSNRETPTLVLEVSGPTIVRFISDSLEGDLTIPIAAEKLQLAPLNK